MIRMLLMEKETVFPLPFFFLLRDQVRKVVGRGFAAGKFDVRTGEADFFEDQGTFDQGIDALGIDVQFLERQERRRSITFFDDYPL